MHLLAGPAATSIYSSELQPMDYSPSPSPRMAAELIVVICQDPAGMAAYVHVMGPASFESDPHLNMARLRTRCSKLWGLLLAFTQIGLSIPRVSS